MAEESKGKFVLDTEQIKHIFSLNSFSSVLELISDINYRSAKCFLFYGPAGEGREVILYDYTKLLLKAGSRIIWVTTRLSPLKIKEILSDFHRDDAFWEKHSSQLNVIDMCGTNVLISAGELGKVTYMESTDLGDLMNKLVHLNEKLSPNIVIIDTVSGLFRYADEVSVIDFLNNVISSASKNDSTTILTLNEGEEDVKVDASISSLCDFIFHSVDMKVTVKVTTYPLSGRDWEIK